MKTCTGDITLTKPEIHNSFVETNFKLKKIEKISQKDVVYDKILEQRRLYMLLQFNFSNFGPFKNEVSLNLESTSYSEYKDQVRSVGSKKILPVCVIFGANASGKSFVYKAFRYMRYMVCTSVNFDSALAEGRDSAFPDPAAFKLDQTSRYKPSLFEIVLTNVIDGKEVTYQYGFSILNRRIDSEWLFKLRKTERASSEELLKRVGDSISINVPKMEKAKKITLESSTQPQTLVLSLASKLNVEPFRSILDFFSASKIDDFANLFEIIYRDHALPIGIVENDDVRKDCVAFMRTFEPSIKDIRIEDTENDQEGSKKYKVFTTHVAEDGSEIRFKMEDESSGTQKMFLLFNDLRQIITSGRVLFVDELNARLHPLLLRNLLLLFLSPEKNPNNAQLIFTCHEPWILRSKTLRRDEIYFTNKKPSTGESVLYSLAEFTDENGVKIRSDEDFEKNYLLGKYDGIPSLDPIGILPEGGKR